MSFLVYLNFLFYKESKLKKLIFVYFQNDKKVCRLHKKWCSYKKNSFENNIFTA